ncbi:MAG: hypothetical protein ACK5NA_02535 [Enterococcus sp.]
MKKKLVLLMGSVFLGTSAFVPVISVSADILNNKDINVQQTDQMYAFGINGISATVAVLFPGVGTAIAGVVAGQIASHGLFNRGVIYKIRGFGISNIVYQ